MSSTPIKPPPADPLAMITVTFGSGIKRTARANEFNFEPNSGGPIVRDWDYVEPKESN